MVLGSTPDSSTRNFFFRVCLCHSLNNISFSEVILLCQVPFLGVRDLSTNFFMNKLLSELGNDTPVTPSCVKHVGEVFKLYCKTCDRLICRDCIVIDHRDHKFHFVAEIYPAEKEEIEKVVDESRKKMLALEKSLKTIDNQERMVEASCKDVSSKVDTFIDNQIQFLRSKQQSLKGELRELARIQKHHGEDQKKSFTASLDSIKSSVEFAEQALKKGDQVQVLSAKKQILKKLAHANSITIDLKPRSVILYDLEIDSPLYDEKAGKFAKIREYDEEYTLRMTLIASDFSNRRAMNSIQDGNFSSDLANRPERSFVIRRKSSNTAYGPVNDVLVKIKRVDATFVAEPKIKKSEDGSFSFSYQPCLSGKYEIDVIVNERYLKGSPFIWQVFSSS